MTFWMWLQCRVGAVLQSVDVVVFSSFWKPCIYQAQLFAWRCIDVRTRTIQNLEMLAYRSDHVAVKYKSKDVRVGEKVLDGIIRHHMSHASLLGATSLVSITYVYKNNTE
jgi:hypothetical protein